MIICILVEWYNHLEERDYYATTYELFENVEKAFDFSKSVKVRRIDLVKAKNTFYENGKLNYEDFSDTIEDSIIGIN